jgi:outer membrane receptor protein involved in Fe transport
MSFSVEGEARTQDNTRKIERWTVGGVFDMRLFQNPSKTINVKASMGWKYMWRYFLPEVNTKYSYSLDGDGNAVPVYDGYNDKEGYWRGSHRLSASLSASYKPSKRWEFSLKETFQYTYSRKANTMVTKYRLTDEDDPSSAMTSTMEEKQYESKDRSVLRTKATVQYNIRHCPVNPYASVDYGCGLNYTTNKWKFTAGTDIKVHRRKVASLYLSVNNLFDRAYQNHLSRLKYVGYNMRTGERGIFDMGRNLAVRLIVPLVWNL